MISRERKTGWPSGSCLPGNAKPSNSPVRMSSDTDFKLGETLAESLGPFGPALEKAEQPGLSPAMQDRSTHFLKNFPESLNVWRTEESITLKTAQCVSFYVRVKQH